MQVLLVGLCGLTNYKRLELLCTFALITVFVDYIIFMSFYPSGKHFYVTSISKAKGVSILSKDTGIYITQNTMVGRGDDRWGNK